MRTCIWFFITFGLVVSCLGQSESKRPDKASIIHKDDSIVISADHANPLWQSITAVREEFGWVVNFEASPLYSQFDTVDDTSPKWLAEHPNAKRVTRPSGGKFTVTVNRNGSSDDRQVQQQMLRDILGSYNRTENPGKYDLLSDDTSWTITGRQLRDQTGSLISIRPFLETPIKLPAGEYQVLELVQAILSASTKESGHKAILFSYPFVDFQARIRVSESNVPARNLLQNALAATHRPLFYDLAYDPDVDTYLLWVGVARKRVRHGDRVDSVPIDRLERPYTK